MNNRTKSKTEHFHRIIDTLKAINNIVVNEKEIGTLIKKICNVMTQTRGYHFCWIGLFDYNNNLNYIEGSDNIEDFDQIKKRLEKGDIPANLGQVIKNQKFSQIKENIKNRPLAKQGLEFTSFIAPILINDEQHGVLCAAVSDDARHPKEAENYTDIAKNIGYAINRIQEKQAMDWLLNTSPDAIIIFDRHLNVVSINKQFESIFKQNNQSIAGKHIPDLIKANLDKKEHANAFHGVKVVSEGKNLDGMELVFEDKILKIETQKYLLKNYQIARVRDITKDRTEKNNLKKSETKYKNLVEGLNDGLFILQDQVLRFVNPALCRMSGFSEKDLLNQPFTKFIAQSELEKVKDRHIKRLWGEHVENIFQTVAINKQGKEIPVEVTVIPVEFEERPAYQIIMHDISERQATLQKLKESEERFRFLALSAFEGIVIHKNGIIIDVNDAMTRLSGYTKRELVGQNIVERLCSEQDVELVKQHISNNINTPYVARTITKSGKLLFISIESRTIQYNGEEVRIAGIKDITERQQLNQKLRDTKNKLNNLLNNLPGTVYTCHNNKNWDMLFMSEGCVELTGYPPEELVNNPQLNYADIIHPAFREKVSKKVEEAVKSNKPFELEYKIIGKNKREKWVWERGRETTYNNEQVLEGFITDITDRKVASMAFIQSQTKYRTLFSAINDAVVIQDYEKKNLPIIEVNNRACELYGYKRDELLSKSIKELSYSNNSHLEKSSEQIYETTHKKADGTVISVEVSSSIFQIGQERRIMSMIRDISERKKAEKKLSDSEHLLENILQSMPSGFVMIDQNRRIRRVNKEICSITGYQRNELEGQKCDIICANGKNSKQCASFNNGIESYTGMDTFIKCNGGSHTAVLKNAKTIVINGEKFILESFQNATQWKIAEQQLIKAKTLAQESEQKFSAFMKSLPGSAFIKDKDLNFQYVNRFMEKNMNAGDWIGKNTKDVVHPDILKKLIKDDEKAFFQGRHKYEEKFPVVGRGMRDFLTYKFTIGDDKKLLGGISIDITERKRLESRNAMLSKAIEASPVSIIITDINGNIEYVNPFFEKKTDYTLQEIIGKNPRILKSDEHPKNFYANIWHTILQGKVWHGELQNKKKNGEIFWEKGIISPITNESGEIVNFIAIKEDITQQKQILNDLKQAKEEAEKSDKLKSAFLANMSHEIRTPMNGIMGFTELLKDPDLDGKQQNEFISIIQKSGDRMLSTLNDIIDISKIESGLVTVDLATIDLKSFLTDILLFFEPETSKKRLFLEFINFKDADSPKIESDHVKLNSIITNLIKNAIKFTKKGGISFGYQFTNKSIQFIVKDTGIGIPKNRQQAIFDRFIQADIADSRVYEGSGLGLAIAKSYTQMLGGTIQLKSAENKGSTFYITFPYDGPPKETIPIAEMFTVPEKLPGDLKVLIAEDDPVSVELLKIILRDKSKQILVAENGKVAVDTTRENPDIDLIMMDIKMPVMDGFEAIERIRDFNKDIKIIAQTAFAQEQDALRAFESGCNNYITKPINATDLFTLINNLFNS